MIENVIMFFIFLLISGDIYTSYRMLKSDDYENFQKVFQLFMIWCIPFIGIFIVLFFLSDERSSTTSYSDNSGAETGYNDSCSGGSCD